MTVDLKMPSYEIAQIADLTVALEPVQDTSGGDPSPSNICPITGHSEVTVTRTGKNLFDKDNIVSGALTSNGTVASNPTKSVSGFIKVKPNTAYYIQNTIPQTTGRSAFAYDEYKNALSVLTILGSVSLVSGVITTPTECAYVRISCTNDNLDILQFEEGSTASDYHAYDGTSYTISLGDTVYGGTLDVLSGVLTVDRAMVDLGTLNWISEEHDVSGQFRVSQVEIIPLNPKYSSVQCSILNGVSPRSFSSFNNGEIGLSNAPTAPVLRARSETFTGKTEAEIKDIMQGQQLVYPLATPTTVQLTAQDVETLTGINNVWSDSGNVSVTISGTTQTGDVVTFTALPHHKIQLFMP